MINYTVGDHISVSWHLNYVLIWVVCLASDLIIWAKSVHKSARRSKFIACFTWYENGDKDVLSGFWFGDQLDRETMDGTRYRLYHWPYGKVACCCFSWRSDLKGESKVQIDPVSVWCGRIGCRLWCLPCCISVAAALSRHVSKIKILSILAISRRVTEKSSRLLFMARSMEGCLCLGCMNSNTWKNGGPN